MRIFGISLAAGMILLTGQSIPQLSDRAISAIQDVAKNNSFYDFAGLPDYDHERRKLFITSNRATIAYKTALAVLNNARYTPAPSERLDVVHIECGDSDLRHLFECARVRVVRPDKSEIRPLAYSAEPRPYSNSSGDRWTVREVSTAYSVEDLSDGFLVEYVSADGVEWTFAVSQDDARERLLLKLANEAPGPIA